MEFIQHGIPPIWGFIPHGIPPNTGSTTLDISTRDFSPRSYPTRDSSHMGIYTTQDSSQKMVHHTGYFHKGFLLKEFIPHGIPPFLGIYTIWDLSQQDSSPQDCSHTGLLITGFLPHIPIPLCHHQKTIFIFKYYSICNLK